MIASCALAAASANELPKEGVLVALTDLSALLAEHELLQKLSREVADDHKRAVSTSTTVQGISQKPRGGIKAATATPSHECDRGHPAVTFITPTYGRESLGATLATIHNQTKSCWRVIVVSSTGTGLPVLSDSPDSKIAPYLLPDIAKDPRISFLTVNATVHSNYGGVARNTALEYLASRPGATTRWVGFVDDDDTVSQHYVAWLLDEEERNADASCVLFRMHCEGCMAPLIPPPRLRHIAHGFAGISFALKTRITEPRGGGRGGQGVLFEGGAAEDFELLMRVLYQQLTLVISPHTAYFVHGHRPADLPSMLQRDPPERTVLRWNGTNGHVLSVWPAGGTPEEWNVCTGPTATRCTMRIVAPLQLTTASPSETALLTFTSGQSSVAMTYTTEISAEFRGARECARICHLSVL
jgi:hypothetical protein